MKVQELMTAPAAECAPQTDLAAAAGLMWENDCGALPVVDEGRVVGMVTDRDICIAAATKPRDLAHIAVGEVITGQLFACAPEADVREALDTMGRQQVRRLPVVDAEGQLCGILSLNDVVLRAEEKKDRKTDGVTYAEVVSALKGICAHAPRGDGQPAPQRSATA